MTRATAPVRIDISAGWSDVDPYRKDFGSSVLNAAIRLRVETNFNGRGKVQSDNVPACSGLGTSSAYRATYLAASNPVLAKDKLDLVRRVWRFENQILKQRAGFQDEAAAIFGGVNLWHFGTDGKIEWQQMNAKKASHLEERLVILYTGSSHYSASLLDYALGSSAYRRNIPRIKRMSDIAVEMAACIDDTERMAALLRESWQLQRELCSRIETDEMRELQEVLQGTYLACRATGAGGGGCMIFYTEQRAGLCARLAAAVERGSISNRVIQLPCKFDYEGIVVENDKC